MSRPATAAFVAAFHREVAANRLNRFLHVHLALAGIAGLLPLFTPGDAAGAAPWWVLQATLYCLSLSTLLLGLSSAHGEADEFPLLFAQPAPRWAWLAGKAAGLAVLVVPAALLLVAPAILIGGTTRTLVAMGLAAGGVSVALTAVGLAVGFWVRDGVRGLLVALGVWFVLLFGADLLLLAIAGVPAVHTHASLWLLPMMLNPLDALRVTVLFTLGEATPAAAVTGTLAGWWIERSALWLALLLIVWTSTAFLAGLAGARRRVDA